MDKKAFLESMNNIINYLEDSGMNKEAEIVDGLFVKIAAKPIPKSNSKPTVQKSSPKPMNVQSIINDPNFMADFTNKTLYPDMETSSAAPGVDMNRPLPASVGDWGESRGGYKKTIDPITNKTVYMPPGASFKDLDWNDPLAKKTIGGEFMPYHERQMILETGDPEAGKRFRETLERNWKLRQEEEAERARKYPGYFLVPNRLDTYKKEDLMKNLNFWVDKYREAGGKVDALSKEIKNEFGY